MKFHLFNKQGFLELDFSEKQLAPVKEEIKHIMDSNFKDAIPAMDNLVGHIKKEFLLVNSSKYLEDLLYPHVYRYAHEMGLFADAPVGAKPSLQRAWVNFQEKHEFNPVHNHRGIISFVIWIQIPYNLQDELKMFPDSNVKRASTFEFVYSSQNGTIVTQAIPVDKSYENKMIMFPADTNHCVHPFYTSDGYRISVAGNFVIQH
jgi:Putative 2OG-Fe(II) oxygenase